jgi:acetolactate synthase-1/2/3 large subunit
VLDKKCPAHVDSLNQTALDIGRLAYYRTKMRGTDVILESIRTAGADHLFLFVGGLVDPFLEPLSQDCGLRPILAANEAGAAYAADGYARASGTFGPVLMIGGPGIFNAAGAIGAASADGVPMLVLSGEAPTSVEGRGYFQDASPLGTDDLRMFDALTGFSHEVPTAAALPQFLRDAYRAMFSAWRRPVHLALPVDVQKADISGWHADWLPDSSQPRVLDGEAFSSWMESRLTPSTHFAILAGWGTVESEASQELREVAERFCIPVATTYRAKGILPEDHPLSLGVFGYAGNPPAEACLTDPGLDSLLVLGSSLNQRDTLGWDARLQPKHGVAHVDRRSAALGKNFPVASPIVGDVRTALRRLLDSREACAHLEATRESRRAWAEPFLSGPRYYDPETRESDQIPLHPAWVIRALREALPRSAALLVDSGAHRAFAGHHFPVLEPRRFFSATGIGPMGWAIAASIGVACALPNEKIAVVTGDGCMLQNGIEIATAARHHLNILFVVINNSALGNVYLRARKSGPGPAGFTLLRENDWAGFALSLGVPGLRARTAAEVEGAFAGFVAGSGPMLVDVIADRDASTPIAAWTDAVAHGNIFSE